MRKKFFNIVTIFFILLVEFLVLIPVSVQVTSPLAPVLAEYQCTGGTVVVSGSYTLHVFNTSGTFYFVTNFSGSIQVECWGGGGGGAWAWSSGGGGGGGGAYARSNISVAAGNYTVVVGIGGTTDNVVAGTASSFNTTQVIAAAGIGTNTETGGSGGSTAASTGDVKYAGGQGGTGLTTDDCGGGGGGAGGYTGVGINGTNATSTLGGNGGTASAGAGGAGGLSVSSNNGNPGTSSILGGGGGAGGDNSYTGGIGGHPGGGGGGGEVEGALTGGKGQVIVKVLTSNFSLTSTTNGIDSIGSTTLLGNGSLTIPSGTVSRRGFCYKIGTTGDPTIADGTAYDDGSFSSGSYTKSITGLTGNTSYRVRAYVVYTGSTTYGSTVQSFTYPGAPVAVSITGQSNSFGLTWTRGQGAYYTNISRKAGSLPANLSDGTNVYHGTGTSFEDGELASGTTYYYLLGSESFNTGLPLWNSTTYYSSPNVNVSGTCSTFPTVLTNSVTDIEAYSSTLRGTVSSLRGTTATSWGFQWDTDSGSPYSNTVVASGSPGLGTFSYSLGSLSAGSTYYLRAFANCSNGSSYGSEASFTTVSPAESNTLITIRETCGTARTHLPVQANVSTSAYINSGFLLSSGLDQEMYESSSPRYSMLNTSWIRTIIPSIVPYSTKDYNWYTGVRPSDTLQDSIIGPTGSINCSDSTDFTVFDSYNISWSGYINTSAMGTLFGVQNSSWLYSSGSGNITAYVLSPSVLIKYLYPVGDQIIGNFSSTGASHYTEIDDLYSSPDEDTTRVYASVPSGKSETYNLSWSIPPSSIWVLNGSLYYRSKGSSGPTYDFVNGAIIYNGSTYSKGQEAINMVYGTSTYVLPTTGFFDPSKLTSIWLYMVSSLGGNLYLTQAYVGITYFNYSSVTYPVSSGPHSISMVGNSSSMSLYVDSSLVGSSLTEGLPRDCSDGVFLDTDVAVATRTATIDVNGYNVLDWGLRTILTGSTVLDYSGKSHNGSITWGTMPTCYTITLGGSQPEEDYTPPEGGDAYEPPDMIPPIEEGDIDPGFWWGGVVDPDLPMYDLFKRAEDAGWGSVYVLYLFVMIATAVAIGLGTTLATGSIMVGTIAVGVVLFAGALAGVIAGWVTVVYGIVVGCYLLVSRSL